MNSLSSNSACNKTLLPSVALQQPLARHCLLALVPVGGFVLKDTSSLLNITWTLDLFHGLGSALCTKTGALAKYVV